MGTPRTYKQTPGGDLDVSSGSLEVTSTLKEYVQVHAGECLALFAGEWFLDTREGIPYFKIVSTRPDMNLLRSLYRRALLAVPGVADVPRIALAFDGKTRTLTVTADVALTDGTVITAVPYLVPWIVTNTGAGAAA